MSVRFVTRQQCGLQPPDPARLSVRSHTIVGVTKHWTGGEGPHVPLDSLRIWRELQAAAMSGNNVNHTRYGDIEYNVGFDDFGQLLVGRDQHWTGAHATSRNNLANEITLGAVYLGTGTPTKQAFDAYHAWLFLVALNIGHAPITLGHQDWVRWGGISTQCPGPVLEHSTP